MDAYALALATYENYRQMWRAVGQISRQGAFEVGCEQQVLVVRSRLTARIPHMVLPGLAQSLDPDTWLPAVLAAVSPDPSSVTVALPPGQESGPLARLLLEEGFTPGTSRMVAMARTTGAQYEGADGAHPISVARTPAELAEARAVMSQVFRLPPTVFTFYTPPEVVTTYLLRSEAAAVGVASLCPFGGYAGIYSVAVLPAWRGRGIARRLIGRALHDAAASGYGAAVLSCEHALVDFYRFLGFEACGPLPSYWLDAWWY